MRTSFPSESEFLAAAALCIGVILAVHAGGTLDTGFFSDDHDFLSIATDTGGGFMEGHHMSLLVPSLFRLAAGGSIGPGAWHGAVLGAHLVSSLLLWLFLRSRLLAGAAQSLFAAALFAASAAGIEALAWPGASGYAFLAPLILSSLLVATGSGGTCPAIALAAIQLAGWAVWDWAVLVFPSILLAQLLIPGAKRGSSSGRLLRLDWPVALCWAVPLVLKIASGYSIAYRAASGPLAIVAGILTAPSIGVAPLAGTGFLRSVPGIAFLLAPPVLLLVAAVRDRRVGLMLLLALLALLPSAVFAVPQSRYLYIPWAFVSAACVLSLGRIRPAAVSLGLSLLLVAGQLVQARMVSREWKDAWAEAEGIRTAVATLGPEEGIVLVNLPDTYGPDRRLFRPWLWRNGLAAFPGVALHVSTPDCPYRREAADGLTVSRAELDTLRRGLEVWEVVPVSPDGWSSFGLRRTR